jgi:hypothetical protein
MSRENVEVITNGIDAWNREGVEGILRDLHADFRGYPFPEWVGDPSTTASMGCEGSRWNGPTSSTTTAGTASV